jgi:Uma2 family endonuclease
LLDPTEACIFVYGANQPTQVFDQAEAVLPVSDFAQMIRLTVGEIFDWLKA